MESMLSPYWVLGLTDEKGFFCGNFYSLNMTYYDNSDLLPDLFSLAPVDVDQGRRIRDF